MSAVGVRGLPRERNDDVPLRNDVSAVRGISTREVVLARVVRRDLPRDGDGPVVCAGVCGRLGEDCAVGGAPHHGHAVEIVYTADYIVFIKRYGRAVRVEFVRTGPARHGRVTSAVYRGQRYGQFVLGFRSVRVDEHDVVVVEVAGNEEIRAALRQFGGNLAIGARQCRARAVKAEAVLSAERGKERRRPVETCDVRFVVHRKFGHGKRTDEVIRGKSAVRAPGGRRHAERRLGDVHRARFRRFGESEVACGRGHRRLVSPRSDSHHAVAVEDTRAVRGDGHRRTEAAVDADIAAVGILHEGAVGIHAVQLLLRGIDGLKLASERFVPALDAVDVTVTFRVDDDADAVHVVAHAVFERAAVSARDVRIACRGFEIHGDARRGDLTAAAHRKAVACVEYVVAVLRTAAHAHHSEHHVFHSDVRIGEGDLEIASLEFVSHKTAGELDVVVVIAASLDHIGRTVHGIAGHGRRVVKRLAERGRIGDEHFECYLRGRNAARRPDNAERTLFGNKRQPLGDCSVLHVAAGNEVTGAVRTLELRNYERGGIGQGCQIAREPVYVELFRIIGFDDIVDRAVRVVVQLESVDRAGIHTVCDVDIDVGVTGSRDPDAVIAAELLRRDESAEDRLHRALVHAAVLSPVIGFAGKSEIDIELRRGDVRLEAVRHRALP